MSFIGTSMIFDGVSSEEMGLALFDFSSKRQSGTRFAGDLSPAQERIEGRYRPLFYGGAVNEPLVFTMVLSATEERVRRNEPFDRWDMQKIAAWLTGHDGYKWLSIVQSDLEEIRYRCFISELEAVEVSGLIWGFSCKVTCDSPFAYLAPVTYTFAVNGGGSGQVFSESSYNGFYYPRLVISGHTGGTISIEIQNKQERGTFAFQGLPAAAGTLTIEGENGVVAAEGISNPYQYLLFPAGFHFPRFARGVNHIALTGTGNYAFTCEWPVNVGG